MGGRIMDITDKIIIPAPPADLQFDEATHTYTYLGEVVPSVTQLLKFLPGNDYANVPENVLEKAAARGTAIHEGIEFYLQCGFDEVCDEWQPYMDAFRKFWAGQENPSALACEYPVYYADDTEEAKRLYGTGYAGTIDLIASIGGQITLLDFKCTSKLYMKKYGLQLEAYSRALLQLGISVAQKIVVQLKPNGSFKAVTLPALDDYSWAVFSALRTISNVY